MKIVTPYYTITPESIARERERLFEKARHDEAQALHHARQVGFAEGYAESFIAAQGEDTAIVRTKIAKNLLNRNIPISIVTEVTGLSEAEIEG